jgi:hypothetical protein
MSTNAPHVLPADTPPMTREYHENMRAKHAEIMAVDVHMASHRDLHKRPLVEVLAYAYGTGTPWLLYNMITDLKNRLDAYASHAFDAEEKGSRLELTLTEFQSLVSLAEAIEEIADRTLYEPCVIAPKPEARP